MKPLQANEIVDKEFIEAVFPPSLATILLISGIVSLVEDFTVTDTLLKRLNLSLEENSHEDILLGDTFSEMVQTIRKVG